VPTLFGYTKFLLQAKTKYKIHSPFVYDLCTTVFEDKSRNESLDQVHKISRELKRNSRVLETTDFGAFDTTRSYVTRFLKVSEIAKYSVSRSVGELLFRLVQKFHPKHIIEMGTSLGVSTLYMSMAAPNARLITIEGCAAKVEIAKANIVKSSVSNIEIKTGRFDTQLPQVLSQMPILDFVFLDGLIHYKPTLWYFTNLLNYFHDDTIVVLNGIRNTGGMTRAWHEIQGMSQVTVTIDLYDVGLIFFNKSLSKQNFKIKY
jgi:predicted O-methyltransferase YrrM